MNGEYRCQDVNDRNSYDEVNVQVGHHVNMWGQSAFLVVLSVSSMAVAIVVTAFLYISYMYIFL